MAVIDHDERLIFLSTFISVGELVRKWIDSKSTDQQPLLSLILIRYIELIHSPFKNDDKNELILNLRRTCKIIVPADTAVAPLKKEAFF